MTFIESVREFAKKLDRVPKEIRAMSGVPSNVRKSDPGKRNPKVGDGN